MRKVLNVSEFIKESNEYREQIINEPGKSRIVDKSGKLLSVYKPVDLVNESNIIDISAKFTTSKRAALGFGKDINEYVLYLENPLFMLNYGKDYNTPADWYNWHEVKEKYFDVSDNPYQLMIEDGYDCLIDLHDETYIIIPELMKY